MNPALRGSAAHVFVESLSAPFLGDVDAHHLGRVLRLRAGDRITLSDGLGSWVSARWVADGAVDVDGETVTDAPPTPTTVGCAIPKGDRPELIVQKLTEIGVGEIVFFETARSVVRWPPEKAVKQLERVHRVAREASMQSRRTRLPIIAVAPFATLRDRPGAAIAEPDGEPLTASSPVTALLIGPEGGFTDDERSQSRASFALGRTILRVETAAIVAATLLKQFHP